MDELAWIARIRERLAAEDPRVAIGIGDDAAVLAEGVEGRVLSVDVAVEGTHFERSWLEGQDLGWRAYVAALSDLAAMGAGPVAGLLSMVWRDGEDEAWLEAVIAGFAEAAVRFDAPVVGGNLSRGPATVLSTTVVGALHGAPLRRSGARPGDGVFVTGPTGEAALGWRVLAAGGPDGEAERRAVSRWRRPRPRFDVAAEIAAIATAGIDVSDGLAQDLGHVAAASAVRIRIDAAALPWPDGFREAAEARGEDPLTLALGGGEDFELAFTAPDGSVDPGVATRIGEVVVGDGVEVLVDGAARPAPAGHRHF